mgnify:CR=1 FL=1
MDRWVIEELSSLNLGDKRLDKRVKKILSDFSRSPLSSIPGSCKGWNETKAAYRCFSNPKISSDKILLSHKQSTIKRAQAHKRVFVLQDTTDLNYSGQQHKQGVGPTRHGKEQALLLHPCLVVSESECCLGVYDDYQWFRSELLSHKADKNTLNNERLHKKHISEKESYRWILGYKKATDLARSCPNTQVITIADREGDIYDLYEEYNNTTGIKADWLIRIKTTKRALMNELGNRDERLLHEKMNTLKPLETIEFDMPRRDNKPTRKIQQELRMAKLTLHPPTGRRGTLRCHPVEVTVVLAKEINTPEGEKPVIWWLMTSVPVEQVQPSQLISWYLCRWQIEIFFKILKSGCQIEQLQLGTGGRTKNCLALYLITHLTHGLLRHK